MDDAYEEEEAPPTVPHCQSCVVGNSMATAVFICQDCPDSNRYICSSCQKSHSSYGVTSAHRVVTLESFKKDPTKYMLAKDTSCDRHPDRQYELYCLLCNALLCIRCLGVDRHCPTAAGESFHQVMALENVMGPLKQEVQDAVQKAVKEDGNATELVSQLADLKSATRSRLEQVVCDLEEERAHMHVAVDNRVNSVRKSVEAQMEEVLRSIKERESDLQVFLENIANDQVVAEGILTCPVPLEVHRMAPDVISRLQEHPTTTLPEVPSLDLVKPDLKALEALLEAFYVSAASPHSSYSSCASEPDKEGSPPASPVFSKAPAASVSPTASVSPAAPMSPAASVPPTAPASPVAPVSPSAPVSPTSHPAAPFSHPLSVIHRVLPFPSDGELPVECDFLHVSATSELVEACWNGLFVAGDARRLVASDNRSCHSVAVSRDRESCYCIRGNTGEGSIQMYRCFEDGTLKLERAYKVEGAIALKGISCCSSGPLAVVDALHPRITLHSADDLQLLQVIQGGAADSMRILSHPFHVAWNPSGTQLYVTDRGLGPVPQSVMCLQLSRPCRVVWRSQVENPWNVCWINGFVYVTHASETKVTVLSARDGWVAATATCPGVCRGMVQDSSDTVVFASYERVEAVMEAEVEADG